LKQWSRDPMAFLADLVIPSASGPRRYRDVWAEFQRKDFLALTPALLSLVAGKSPAPFDRFWIERTKGGSKDTDIAACLLWLIIFSPRPLEMRVGARDEGQAQEERKALRDIVKLNSWVEEYGSVQVQAKAVVNLRTETRLDIIPADALGSHGGRPAVTFLNELTHVSDEEFPQVLMDDADKMAGRGIVIVATNAGYAGTWQETWRQTAIDQPNWYFSALSEPAPWILGRTLAEAKRRNPAFRYRRLWKGEWTQNGESAIDPDVIDKAITLPGPVSRPRDGWLFAAGLDLSLRRDSCALVAVGVDVGRTKEYVPPEDQRKKLPTAQRIIADLDWDDDPGGLAVFFPPESSPPQTPLDFPSDDPQYCFVGGTGQIRLAACLIWRPRGNGATIRQEPIERAILGLHRRLGLSFLLADEYQAAGMIERLRAAGLTCEGQQVSTTLARELCSVTLDAFNESRIELYDKPDLITDLKALQAVEKSYGLRLESPRKKAGEENEAGTRHGDSATALGLALIAAKRAVRIPATTVGGPLICYP